MKTREEALHSIIADLARLILDGLRQAQADLHDQLTRQLRDDVARVVAEMAPPAKPVEAPAKPPDEPKVVQPRAPSKLEEYPDCQLLKISKACEILDVSRPTLYSLFDQGELDWVGIGGERRVSVAAIRKLIRR